MYFDIFCWDCQCAVGFRTPAHKFRECIRSAHLSVLIRRMSSCRPGRRIRIGRKLNMYKGWLEVVFAALSQIAQVPHCASHSALLRQIPTRVSMPNLGERTSKVRVRKSWNSEPWSKWKHCEIRSGRCFKMFMVNICKCHVDPHVVHEMTKWAKVFLWYVQNTSDRTLACGLLLFQKYYSSLN